MPTLHTDRNTIEPDLIASIVAPADLGPVVDVLDQAAARLHARGVDQWPVNFAADGGKRLANLRDRAARGEVFLLADRDGTRPVGTISVSREPDPDFAPFWPKGTVEDAVYLYRIAVADAARGTGIADMLLTLAAHVAMGQGLRYVRADCSRTNTALHDWYRGKGFSYMGTVEIPGRKSGALWQMDLSPLPRVDAPTQLG
jgi:ribosomal protein S18 acetylase RimI-like enzyme